eukprot:TRINITY_DN5981_c0_g2_i11.p1 TRINITY_DN5981_c0_g2~~TRINITY_DN5981_c0_g2_i11.p1  ORF type:complete len:375 (-),score=30.12 TRINITY_DN5981_c0_g2_i11:245-1369(-)
MSCTGCFTTTLPIPSPKDFTIREMKEMYQMCLENNGGRLIVHGLVARASVINSNHRKYPKRILKRELNKFLQRHIHKFTALGELDHPSYQSPVFRHLNLPNVSHQVLSLQWRGDYVYGVIEVLDSCSGRFVNELFKQGFPVGVSTRGWASTKQFKKAAVIQKDFDLITLDFVPEPSTSGAFVLPMVDKYIGVIADQRGILEASKLGVGALPFPLLNYLNNTKNLTATVLKRMTAIKSAKQLQISTSESVQVSLDICEDTDDDNVDSQDSQDMWVGESIHTRHGQGSQAETQPFYNECPTKTSDIHQTKGTHDQPSLFTEFTNNNQSTHQVYYSCYEIDPDFICHVDQGIRNYSDHLKVFRNKVISQAKKVLKFG